MLSTIGVPVILGTAPALFWLVFFLLEDKKNPEPRPLIAGIFVVGALSALAAAVIQLIVQDALFPAFFITDPSVFSLFIFAFIEEAIKFLAAYLIVSKNKCFDEPVDAMIYTITAGLGFAALENTIFIASPTGIPFETMMFRFVGATLLHALASGLVGFYWVRRRLFLGLFIATVLHLIFNILILEFSATPFYASGILIFASFFLFYDFDILKAYGKRPCD